MQQLASPVSSRWIIRPLATRSSLSSFPIAA